MDRCRYYLRAVICRKLNDFTKEMTLWCPSPVDDTRPAKGNAIATISVPVEMEVGLEDFLHIKMNLRKSVYAIDEEIVGILSFFLVRLNIVSVEAHLIRKEFAAGDETPISQEKISFAEILDGPAYGGDIIPVHLDLASVKDRLGPTLKLVNKMFSIRYFVAVILRDTENRKYYKQVEIELVKSAPSTKSPEENEWTKELDAFPFKLALVVQ